MKLRHRIGSLVLTLIMFFSMGVITHAANYKLNVAVVGDPTLCEKNIYKKNPKNFKLK